MITDLLERQARENGSRIFLRTDAGSLSFATTFDAVQRFAGVLQGHGIGKGDHVALAAANSTPWVVAMLAINWLGGVCVALNNRLLGEGLRYTLHQSDSKLIVADQVWHKEMTEHLDAELQKLPLILLHPEVEFLDDLPLARAAGERVEDSSPCTILYTSGTTGLPKGVVNSHHCYEAVGRDTSAALALGPSERIMVFLPLFHTNPQMYALMSALTMGCSLILRRRFSASAFFDDAKRFGATGFTFVGTVMSILVIQHPEGCRDHTLRFAVGGGTPVPIWHTAHQRFGFRIHELYGMTEIGGWVSCNVDAAYRIGSCGRVRGCVDVRVFGPDDVEVPRGTAGEIVVRPLEPDVILSGYYRKPEALVECSRNFWFHTGDRGTIDDDGYLYFHGRTKELIRRGGEMISPAEIETHLRRLPGVTDCAVVGVADEVMGEEIKACVVPEGALSAAAVRDFLLALLPSYMAPRYVEFVPAIPKTETEKIQRNKLQYLDDRVSDLGAAR